MKKIFYKNIIPTLASLVFGFSISANAALDKKVNGEWATITGEVTSVEADYFYLKSNGDKLIVEMDDFDLDADGYKLIKGDQVVVTGRVDHDLFEKKKIEAGSVYVKGIDTTFYASAADEEDLTVVSTSYYVLDTLPEGATADAQGVVTRITGDEFYLDTGLRSLRVDTDRLRFNPLDDIGLVQIDKGDRVRVSGIIDKDFLRGKEIEARYILEL